MGYGVIGSPADSGSVSLGSSPGTPASVPWSPSRSSAFAASGPSRCPSQQSGRRPAAVGRAPAPHSAPGLERSPPDAWHRPSGVPGDDSPVTEYGVDGALSVLVQAALNGGTTRAEHPAVPLTPAELAAEARAAAEPGRAGAASAPARRGRGADARPRAGARGGGRHQGGDRPAGRGDDRASGPSTETSARRLDLVARWTGPDRPDYASINMNEPGTDDLADLLTSLGIAIEAGVWTAGRRAPARRGRASGTGYSAC